MFRGAFLGEMGNDWRSSGIRPRAMMEYFKPLMTWLEEQNKGRQISWE